MMSNNKILTVSYGTFSCTLEGFDDSFGTMKAIAEYFRDLASEDRYFGAEPPQPDAEMLARIAQKEISRRVEAREHEGKIVLSAVEEQHVPAASPPASAVGAGTAATALLADAAPDSASEVASEGTDHDVDAPAQASVQEDTGEEEAFVEQSAEAQAAPEAEEIEEADADDVAPVVQDLSDVDIVPGQPDSEVEAFFAGNASEAAQGDDEFEELGDGHPAAAMAAPQGASKGDSIAEKLQRIRAVVAQQDDDDGYSEDEHAEGGDAAADTMAADITDISDETDALIEARSQDEDDLAELEETVDEITEEMADESSDPEPFLLSNASDEFEEEAEDLPVASADDDDDVAALLSRLDRAEANEAAISDHVEEPIADHAQAEAEEEDLLEHLVAAEVEADVEAEEETSKDASNEAAAQATALEAEASIDADVEAQADAAVSEEVFEEDSAAPAPEVAPEPAKRPAPRARVIKVKRAALEAAIEHGQLEEYGYADADHPTLNDLAPAKFGTTSLSADDEAELARELAALEADIESDHDDAAPLREAAEERADVLSEAMSLSDDHPEDLDEAGSENLFAEDEVDDNAADAEATAETRRNELPSLDAEQGGDMSRLMAEADHQMGEPESATRRDAFAHLRAAVAAKKADEALGTQGDADKSDDAYRNDLADVVQPRRPGRSGKRTARPGEGRPAPLKLVAEQRIDTDSAAAAGPVRPRRVAAVVDAPQTEGEDFGEFAAEVGATSLPELLEAAAAYMSFVEGREQFSRPQLMTKVRQVGPEEGFSREDGLRHFGQLLRAGKIEKIKGGRFTVSEDIGFRPDQRAVG